VGATAGWRGCKFEHLHDTSGLRLSAMCTYAFHRLRATDDHVQLREDEIEIVTEDDAAAADAQADTAAAEPELVIRPEDLPLWEAVQDDEGDTYFYNTQTGVSTWENVHELAASFASSATEATGAASNVGMPATDAKESWALRDQLSATKSELRSAKDRIRQLERENG